MTLGHRAVLQGEGESTTKSHLKLQCREFEVNRIRRDAAAVEEEKNES